MTASLTAYNIVVALKNQGVQSRYLEAFWRFGADGMGKKMLRALPAALHLRMMELLFVPGMSAHFVARKKLIRAQAEKAIAEGITQIIVVGAGFDTLALTLAEQYPQITCMEMDLPATQQQKKQALQKAGITVAANVTFHACDLSQSQFTQELKKIAAFNSSKPALFIFEGVLMYVPEAAVQQTFKEIAALHPLNLLLFGAMAKPDSEGGLFQRMIAAITAHCGEHVHWICTVEKMPVFLSECGYTLQNSWIYREMQHHPHKVRLPEDDEHYYLAAVKKA